ncbi:MAG: ABC transporter permease [bacterium]
MRTIITIFKKELIDTLRDRRTLIAMVLIPLLLFPLLIGISSKIVISQAKKAREKVLRVAIVRYDNADLFKEMLAKRDGVRIVENIPVDSVRSFIQKDSLDGAFVFSKNFDRQVANLQAGRIKVYYKSTEDDDITKNRLLDLVKEFEKQLISHRFKELNLDENIAKTIKLIEVNIATAREKIGKAIGGFIPYLFIIFCFTGSMYPAIDLGAGEKERGTIETLLTSPVNRLQILLGKFGVVVLTGITSAIISMVGLYVGIRQVEEIPKELFDALLGILEIHSIILVLSLLLPLTIFFAGFQLSISIYTRSFKEAQSIISPMMIAVIVPAFLGLIPGITLNTTTALIPVLNVSLATKEILSGTIKPVLLAEVYISLIVLAGISLFLCSKWFEREETIFRV